jgi:transposase
MMGQQTRTESLFYYFRLEDQIPEDHLLRLIDHYVDFRFVRERLKSFYSSTGRPSIDPEILLRLLLIGYLYGITSERRLLEDVRMHLAYRWFTRLDFTQEIPDHSTLSKNRHGRFRQSGVFREVFEAIVMKTGRQWDSGEFRPLLGFRSNFSPIQEGGCTECVRVSDTRCGTCVICAAYLQSRCSPS